MESGIKEILNNLIDGSIEELDGPIRDISARLTMAARRKRMDLVEASKDQLALIVLEKRLRIEEEGSSIFESMLGMGINVLINGAIDGLGSVRR